MALVAMPQWLARLRANSMYPSMPHVVPQLKLREEEEKEEDDE